MLSRLSVPALAVLLALPAAAQAPEGWQLRLDRSTNAADPDDVPDVKFVKMGNGYHVTTGPAVVLWKPTDTASGAFTIKARFRLVKPSGHTNYYGLVFGGSDLAGASQSYLYFLVAQNGTFIIRHRDSTLTHDVQGRAANAAVARPDSTGVSVNVVEVRVAADRIEYVVNGIVVHTTPKAGLTARTDGLWACASTTSSKCTLIGSARRLTVSID
jgi:hypothetical protein